MNLIVRRGIQDPVIQLGDGAMTKNPAQKYILLAMECRQKAAQACRSVDRKAWLKLAKDWDKLTRGADLRRTFQTISEANCSSADEP